MSGQWEVVGKSKIKHSGQPVKKLSKSERKKFVEKAPKVEDILPLSQVKSLYTALELNKENKKAPGKENAKELEPKKVQKKITEKKKEPGKEKPAPPKSLENAVRLINLQEMTQELDIGQSRFHEAPLIWLKGLATYLNTKLTVEHNNPTFLGKPVDYPLCLLSGEIKELLKRALRDAGESVSQPFYEWCLTSMANNMTKGSGSALGYKVILQLLAFQNPSIVVANIPKVTALRNSYQNRQPIGLSLLWALGLGGFKDLSVGITVWQEVMVPMLELRNYSSYVIGYIRDILSHKACGKPLLRAEQFFAVLDVIFSPKLNLPSNIQRQELSGIVSLLKNRILEVEPEKGFCSLFHSLLERLELETSESLQKELLACLMACLNKDAHSYSIWRQLYVKNLPQSALLLGHLDSLWKTGTQPTSCKHLKETLVTFQATNEELGKNKQKEEGLEECKKFCAELIKKMTVTRSFPWKLGSFMLIVAIGGVLAYDVKLHGSFQRSCLGLFLNDIGALHYGEHAWVKTKQFSDEVFRQCVDSGAHYYEIISRYGEPYLAVVNDIYSTVGKQLLILQGYIKEKIPVFAEWINFYAPGLLETLNKFAISATENLSRIWYAVSEMVLQYSYATVTWMKTNVFVGNFSLDNIQQYVTSLMNTSQAYGEWTYNWVWQKVQTLSKDLCMPLFSAIKHWQVI